MIKVRFLGNEYVVIGTMEDGALATESAFRHGYASFAHIFPSGEIRRFGDVIGSRSDITVINNDVPDIGPEDETRWNNLFFRDSSWLPPAKVQS